MDASSRDTAPPAQIPRARWRGLAIPLLAGGLILAVAAVAVVVLLLNRGPATYPPGSPEAAFQRYLAAWEQGDYDTAHAQFSSRIRARVDAADYRSTAIAYTRPGDGSPRVVLLASRPTASGATLQLRVDHWSPGNGLSGGYSWSTNLTVTMVREGGGWFLDDYLAGTEPLGAVP